LTPLVSLGGLLLCLSPTTFAGDDGLTQPVDYRITVPVSNTVPSRVNRAHDLGRVEPTRVIHEVSLTLSLSNAQHQALNRLLEEQRDPLSPQFRKWLTPEEFGARFGPSRKDIDQVTAWLETRGLTIEHIARGRGWIEFSGPAERMESAFNTELHYYQTEDETHFANASPIFIPKAFAGIVNGVRGFNDFPPKRLHTAKRVKVEPQYTSGGIHALAPDDLATIYNIASLYQAGIDGTGQKLAIAGQTQINLTDVPAFRSFFHLPANDPQIVLYGTDPGIRSGDYLEAMLDLEWSGAVARNATIVYVYSSDVFTSVMHAIDDNLAPVLSVSYGACEELAPMFQSWAQQANAEGITWMNASGDGGAAGCGADYPAAVLLPANIPEVTGVGGTEFSDETGGPWWSAANSATDESALSYIPEKAWIGSGGGASQYYAKPVWQSGPGVPADGARDVPDVALSASTYDPYLVYSNGWWWVGGTSASSPSFAGIVTLLNHYLVSNGYPGSAGLGNINPTLYQLAQSTPAAFHDIVSGNNIANTSSGLFGYQAAPGYDQATGLGSVDAYTLVTQWNGQPPSMVTTTVVAATVNSIPSTGSVQITAIVSAAMGSIPPPGTVTLAASGTPLGSAALQPWGISSLATFVVDAGKLAMGPNTVTATYSGSSSFSNSSASLPIMVTQSVLATLSVSANPPSIPATGSSQLMVTVAPAQGSALPVGTVSFVGGDTTLGTAHLLAMGPWATAGFQIQGSELQLGENTITVVYRGSGGVSQASVTVTVSAAE
jgi:subtilase family serine protease